MKVPTIVEVAKTAMDTGQCVVIGLQTTGEASLDSEMNRTKGEMTSFVSLCREILSRFISQYFPTFIEGKSEPTEDAWSATAKKMLLEFADKIELPDRYYLFLSAYNVRAMERIYTDWLFTGLNYAVVSLQVNKTIY